MAANTQAGALSDKALESFDMEAALRLAPEEYLPDDYLASCRELVKDSLYEINVKTDFSIHSSPPPFFCIVVHDCNLVSLATLFSLDCA